MALPFDLSSRVIRNAHWQFLNCHRLACLATMVAPSVVNTNRVQAGCMQVSYDQVGAGEIVGILCKFHTTTWTGTRSASWLMSRYWLLHTTICFSYRWIKSDVNRQSYLETTISGYWYWHCTSSKGLGIQWSNAKRSCDMKTLIATWGKFPSGNNGSAWPYISMHIIILNLISNYFYNSLVNKVCELIGPTDEPVVEPTELGPAPHGFKGRFDYDN